MPAQPPEMDLRLLLDRDRARLESRLHPHEPFRAVKAGDVNRLVAELMRGSMSVAPDAYAPLAEVARRLGERGATAVVLGCTEIPLGIQAGPALDLPFVDTIDSLARESIRWARNERSDRLQT